MQNFLECRFGIIHADSGSGDDHTLCGLTTVNIIESEKDYDRDEEDDLLPQLVQTKKKVTCPQCASIIRWCCHIGTKSIGVVKEITDA